MTDFPIKYRAVIEFLMLEGQSAEEIHTRLIKVYGDPSPSELTVYNWMNELKGGQKPVSSDIPCEGPLKTISTTDDSDDEGSEDSTEVTNSSIQGSSKLKGFHDIPNPVPSGNTKRKLTEMAEEKVEEGVKKPSEETEDYWLYVFNETDSNNMAPTTKCGKWLIFQNVEQIDEAWEIIKTATGKGQLGFSSKVSTMKDKDGRSNQSTSQSVICVYTYDWTDKTDVLRARKQLTDLGFTNKLPYKSDGDTLAGNYSARGKRVSKYYC